MTETIVGYTDTPERIVVTRVDDDGRLVGYSAVATERLGAMANHATDPHAALVTLRYMLAGHDGRPEPTTSEALAWMLDPSYMGEAVEERGR